MAVADLGGGGGGGQVSFGTLNPCVPLTVPFQEIITTFDEVNNLL